MENATLTTIPDRNDVIVVGSGIGGLTCALDLARQGLKVCVFEQHKSAGGYAHAFYRRGYHFDLSLHYIGGLAPGCLTHNVLMALGVLPKLHLKRRDKLFVAEFPDFTIELPNQVDGLKEMLKDRFPRSRDGIDRLFELLPKIKRDVVGPGVHPDYPVPAERRLSVKYSQSTLAELFAEHVKEPDLLAVLGQLWSNIGLPPNLSSANFSTCVFCSSFLEGSYHIRGGGAALVRAMVERLRELGGDCFLKTGVRRIEVKNDRVRGVELEDGKTISADVVVSNANPYHTFFELIPGNEISKIYRFRLRQMQSSLSFYAWYLGLDCLPSELGIPEGNFMMNYGTDCAEAYERALGHQLEKTDWCATNYEDTDESICPKGTGIVSIVEPTQAFDWLDLDQRSYEEKKQEVASILLAKYERRFPGLTKHITASEFATPRTMAHYTRNHQGAAFGFAQLVEQSNSKRLRNRTPIGGLFLTGAWTWSGGGYEGAMMTGIQSARSILQEMGRKYTSIEEAIAAETSTERVGSSSQDDERFELKSLNQKLAGIKPNLEYYRHRLKVAVFGDDLNSRGYAGVSSYLRYLDRGRVEAIESLCKEVGCESWLTGYTVNVYRIEADCATVVGMGNLLEVRTGIRRISSHRAAFDQRIVDTETSKVVVDSVVEVLFLDNDERKLVPVPGSFPTTTRSEPAFKKDRHEILPFTDENHFPFRSSYRVYYEDTDCQAITYHVSYARFCERALQEMVQTVWPEMTTRSWMMKNRTNVARIDIRYLNASTLGDWLEVRTGVLDVTEYQVIFGQRITLKDVGKVTADITTVVEFRDQREELVKIPKQVLDAALEQLPGTTKRVEKVQL